jgi:hypothetical protein
LLKNSYFTGKRKEPNESKYKKLEIANDFIFSVTEDNGFFIEQAAYELFLQIGLKREFALARFEDETNNYIIFINDKKRRDTISYNKSNFDEESVNLVFNEFKKTADEVFTISISDENTFQVEFNEEKQLFEFNDLNIKVFTSSSDMILNILKKNAPILLFSIFFISTDVFTFFKLDKRFSSVIENTKKSENERIVKFNIKIKNDRNSLREQIATIQTINNQPDLMNDTFLLSSKINMIFLNKRYNNKTSLNF